MPYTDGTDETAEPQVRPTICPLCGGEIAIQWSGRVMHNRLGYRAVASPVFVCKTCEIAVRLHRLPKGKLRPTRKAARADVAKECAERERELRDRVAARIARYGG